MIKKISSSELDKLNLLSVRGQMVDKQNVSEYYKKRVVNKPWGYEYLMFENKHVAVWILYLKRGASTSMHCHPKKITSLIVLSGQVETSSLDAHYHLEELDALEIDKSAFHTTMATSSEGALIMEIETPPDKSDLVRLKDNYGREGKGYEGCNYMSTKLSEYEYFDFHDFLENTHNFVHKKYKSRHIRIQKNKQLKDLLCYLDQCEKAIVCFLDTNLMDDVTAVVVSDVGSIIAKSELEALDTDKLRVNADSHILIIH